MAGRWKGNEEQSYGIAPLERIIMLEREQLEGFGSLIAIKGTDPIRCLGDLFYAEGRGCFCPDNGMVPVSKEEADDHNKALDRARIEGLDKNCEVGMHGIAYYDKKKGIITTFMGTVISNEVSEVKPRGVLFYRNGMAFKGRIRSGDELIDFERMR